MRQEEGELEEAAGPGEGGVQQQGERQRAGQQEREVEGAVAEEDEEAVAEGVVAEGRRVVAESAEDRVRTAEAEAGLLLGEEAEPDRVPDRDDHDHGEQGEEGGEQDGDGPRLGVHRPMTFRPRFLSSRTVASLPARTASASEPAPPPAPAALPNSSLSAVLVVPVAGPQPHLGSTEAAAASKRA